MAAWTIEQKIKAAAKKAENKARDERIAACHAAARIIVAKGVCPDCGTKLIRNFGLTGWWQCGAYGVDYMRKPEFKALPHCSFQCFTES